MKRILLCAACLLMLAGCGAQGKTNAQTEASPVEGETLLTLPETVQAQTTAADEKTSGKALEKDGAVYGFELRFPQSPAAEKLLADPENYYCGILENGKKRAVVPTEEIRVLTDIKTHEFVVTILLPADFRLSGKYCTVSLCVLPRDAKTQDVLFEASEKIQIP